MRFSFSLLAHQLVLLIHLSLLELCSQLRRLQRNLFSLNAGGKIGNGFGIRCSVDPTNQCFDVLKALVGGIGCFFQYGLLLRFKFASLQTVLLDFPVKIAARVSELKPVKNISAQTAE